jgi:hypothetical protein
MAYEKLVLHPLNPRAILHDPAALVDGLREKGLVGAAFSWDGDIHYAAGPRFRELLLFRRPNESGVDPHVSIVETSAEPLFLGAGHARPPRCPSCQWMLEDWRSQLRSWQRERQRGHWRCTRCGRLIEVERLDWDHTGGIARYSLDLWGIRHNAAVPSDELLEFLEAATREKWNYFYYLLGTVAPGGIQPSPGR